MATIPYRIELDHRGRVIPPSEVFEAYQRERRLSRSAPSQTSKPKAPSWATPPWWYTEYLDERSVEIGVGEGRALAAAAARVEACRALGISKWEMPELRFYDRPRADAPDDLPAYFEWSPSGGVAFVKARQSLLATAVCVVHECAHAHESRKLGGLDRNERAVRACHEDFERYMQRCWGIYDHRLYDRQAVYWAKQVLYGRPRSEWTAPEWMT
jgi:hypothetical protein